jgi:hypothetical protein
MDFLFVGCSNTWGDELREPSNSRYSKLLCDSLGVNEHNIAECGTSNDWIARRTVEETQKKKYDRVYVQLTVPVRSELYTLRSGPMRLPNYRLPNSEHYLKFYNIKHGIENMYKNKFIIERAVNDTELVFLGLDCCKENRPHNRRFHSQSIWKQFCEKRIIWLYEDIIGDWNQSQHLLGARQHPLESSHRKIADYLLEYGYHSH